MLDPRDRRLLPDALRPPDGYSLDAGIGTTYTLDLIALLTAPLSFARYDRQNENGRLPADPLVLFEAVRSHAERLTLFCQAGRIKVPTRNQELLAYLERSVVEVTPRSPKRVFHPKVWVFRFVAADRPVRYRVVCLSRNLTFDRSWDTTLVLDGERKDRRLAFKRNHPLADFVKALPSLALRKVSKGIKDRIDQFQRELRVVNFELPTVGGKPLEDVTFWPMGIIPGAKSPFELRIDRALVISPFLKDKALKSLAGDGKEHILVSRPDALSGLQQSTFRSFRHRYTLSDAAEGEPDPEGATEGGADEALRGLHAKVYVIDWERKSSILTGSANATNAALHGNIEFLVELTGSRKQCGIDAVLGEAKEDGSLMSLLQKYEPPESPSRDDPTRKRLEEKIDEARRAVINARPRVRVEEAGESLFEVILETDTPLELPRDTELRCWPITVNEGMKREVAGNESATSLGRLSFEALTSFMSFEIQSKEGKVRQSECFALNLPVEGMPADRQERILHTLLKDPKDVLRLLLLLLADNPEEGMNAFHDSGKEGAARGTVAGFEERQLFESLLRCLDRSPERLDRVARIVKDLRTDPEKGQWLPARFFDVWAPIWKARQEMQREEGPEAA